MHFLGYKWIFVITGALSLGDFVLRLFVRRERDVKKVKDEEENEKLNGEITERPNLESLKYFEIFKNTPFVLIVIAHTLLVTIYGVIEPTLCSMILEAYQLGPFPRAMLYSATIWPNLLTSVLAGTLLDKGVPPKFLIAVSACISASAILPIIAIPKTEWAYILPSLVFFGGFLNAAVVTCFPAASLTVSPSRQTQAYSILMISYSLAMIIGPHIGVSLLTYHGSESVVILVACMVFSAAFVVLFVSRQTSSHKPVSL